MPELTLARLKEVLDYNPKTGVFTWRVRLGQRAPSGGVAGSVHKRDGYRRIAIDGASCLANRLAWLYINGGWPPDGMDHINGVRHDNRSSNLRLATHSVNNKNKKRYCNNTSGTTGVCWYYRYSKWNAIIKLNGKSKNLGYFTNKKEAIRVRKAAEKKYGYHPNHGRR